jgi:drug/metabolite transporter (DMT)-like permease
MRGVLTGRRLAVYLLCCAAWGSSWLVIKVGLTDLPPLLFAGVRMGIACLLLVPFALRDSRPTAEEARWIAVAGFFQIGLSYALIFTASQWIPSGLAALLFGSFPIWIGLLAHWQLPDEPLTRRAVLAAGLGLAGVAVIELPDLVAVFGRRAGPIAAGGGLILVSALVSAYGSVVVKKHLWRVAPRLNVCGQTFVASVFLLLSSAFLEMGEPARWTPKALGAVLYLSVFGTVLTFVGLFWLIPRVPVAIVGTIPLVETLLAVLLGAWILGEKLPARVFAGGALILAGVFLVSAGRAPRGAAAG